MHGVHAVYSAKSLGTALAEHLRVELESSIWMSFESPHGSEIRLTNDGLRAEKAHWSEIRVLTQRGLSQAPKRRADASCSACRRKARISGSMRTVPSTTYRTAAVGESVGTLSISNCAICRM